MYCCVCGGPFKSYPPSHYPKMKHIDTTWLEEAIVEDTATGETVKVSEYDSYGRFTDKNGLEHDVGEKEYNGEVRVYHTACANKPKTNLLKGYQEQHFDIDGLVKQGRQQLLSKPE